MKIASLVAPGKFTIIEQPLPEIEADEVLVKTKSCGICTSEHEIWKGTPEWIQYPLFIGHEASGIVETVGSKVTDFQPGDHVAAWIESRGYADYFSVKCDYIYKLKPETPFDLALGEPISCSVNGVRKLDVQLNESVCIVGCGFMGLIMLQVFRVRGAGLMVVVDTRETMLQLAAKLGATHCFNPLKMDVAKAVKDLTGGKGVDIGVEAAGKQETLDLTSNLVRMEGKLEVFGFHLGEARRVNWGFWNWMAFQIVNGHSRSAHIYVEGMRIGLELLEAGKLNMAALVTHRFPLDEINDAFRLAINKPDDFVKAVVVFMN